MNARCPTLVLYWVNLRECVTWEVWCLWIKWSCFPLTAGYSAMLASHLITTVPPAKTLNLLFEPSVSNWYITQHPYDCMQHRNHVKKQQTILLYPLFANTPLSKMVSSSRLRHTHDITGSDHVMTCPSNYWAPQYSAVANVRHTLLYMKHH